MCPLMRHGGEDMRKTLALLMAVAFAISACTTGGGASGSAAAPGSSAATAPSSSNAPSSAPASFAADSTMGEIKASGKLVCGTKFDVIAFGFKNPTTNEV